MAVNPSGPDSRVIQCIVKHAISTVPRSDISDIGTIDTALNGIDGIVKPIDLTTSGGGTLHDGHWRPYDKSQMVVRDHTDRIRPTPLLISEVDKFRVPKPAPIDVATCLKEERLPVLKSERGLSRLFCIFPIPFLVYARYFTVPLLSYAARNAFALGCLVGISPFGHDFHRLSSFLSVFRRPKYWCPDYGAYEYTVPQNVTRETYRFLSLLLPPCHRPEFLRMSESLFCVRVIGSRFVIYRNGGTVSGSPLTLLFNSLSNRFLIRSAIFCVCRQRAIASPYADDELADYIHASLRDGYFGDDHLLAIDYDALPIEPSEVAAVLASWRMSYTSNDKTSELCAYDSLSDCTFLKRKFWRNSFGLWVGLLEPKVIFETLQWYHTQRNVPTIESIDAVFRSMMEEISLYGCPAQRLFSCYVDYLYSFHFRAVPPPFDYIARSMELDLYSESSPDFFFQAFSAYHSSLVEADKTHLYAYLKENLPSEIYLLLDERSNCPQ